MATMNLIRRRFEPSDLATRGGESFLPVDFGGTRMIWMARVTPGLCDKPEPPVRAENMSGDEWRLIVADYELAVEGWRADVHAGKYGEWVDR